MEEGVLLVYALWEASETHEVQYYDWTLKVQLASKDADEMVVQQANGSDQQFFFVSRWRPVRWVGNVVE